MIRDYTRQTSTCALALVGWLVLSVALRAEGVQPGNETTTLTGSLIDDAGNPIAGAKLAVLAAWKQVNGSRERASGGGSGLSDGEGRVKLENLPKETILSLRFSHPDFSRYWFEVTTADDPTMARKHTLWEILGDNFVKRFERPRKVQIKLVGNDGKAPLPGVVIEARPATDSDQIHFDNEWSAMGATDENGFVKLLLPQGWHELSLGNDRPLDCLELNETKLGVRGTGYLQTFLRMTRPGADVVFKAIDADTGRPMAGVSFWRENPAGEYWYEIVRNENVGSVVKDVSPEDARKVPYVTDKDGYYRCQMRPARGWTYHVHHRAEGYDEVDAQGQKFDIPDEGTVERIFYLRKRPKDKPASE